MVPNDEGLMIFYDVAFKANNGKTNFYYVMISSSGIVDLGACQERCHFKTGQTEGDPSRVEKG